jgi:hypothetical protein
MDTVTTVRVGIQFRRGDLTPVVAPTDPRRQQLSARYFCGGNFSGNQPSRAVAQPSRVTGQPSQVVGQPSQVTSRRALVIGLPTDQPASWPAN